MTGATPLFPARLYGADRDSFTFTFSLASFCCSRGSESLTFRSGFVRSLFVTPYSIIISFPKDGRQLLRRMCNAYNLSKLMQASSLIISSSKDVSPLD